MAYFQLAAESDALLEEENDDDLYDEELYRTRNALYLKKKKAVKRWRVGAILALVCGLTAIIAAVLYTRSIKRRGRPDPTYDFPVTELEPEFFQDYGSKRVQIKYGPFTVPGSDENNGMEDFGIKDARMPCHGCLITWMQAGLEFADGTTANAATGMWLHHTVFANEQRQAVKSCNRGPDQFFASGNERTPLDLTLNGTEKTGYWLAETDRVFIGTELMNESKDHQDAYLTITYEYLPRFPSEFSKATSIWLDGGGCDTEVPVPDNKPFFEFEMEPWTSTVNGRLLTILSHLHDGGVNIDVARNDETVCQAFASYDCSTDHMHHMPGMDMSHISYMSPCFNPGTIKKGDQWTVRAQYNLTAHEPMLGADGKPEPVMGISVMYVIED